MCVCQCESLAQENEQLREKVEELTVDLQIIKEEINTAGTLLIHCSVCLSVCLSVTLYAIFTMYTVLFCLYACLSVCMSVCMSLIIYVIFTMHCSV